jgi:hypothetical protein
MQRNLACCRTVAAALSLAFLCGAASSVVAAAPEVSFNVQTLKEENVEGPDVERTYFTAVGKKIVFGKPAGTEFRATDAGFLLVPTEEGVTGEIQVAVSPLTVETDLAQNALTYREAAAKNMPKGAENAEVLQPVLDTFPYNGWKSIGFTWTYSTSGRAMIRDVSFINLEVGVQVMVTTITTKEHSDKVRKLAQEFLSSWWVKE